MIFSWSEQLTGTKIKHYFVTTKEKNPKKQKPHNSPKNPKPKYKNPKTIVCLYLDYHMQFYSLNLKNTDNKIRKVQKRGADQRDRTAAPPGQITHVRLLWFSLTSNYE